MGVSAVDGRVVKKMKITKRDVEIIQFINNFGFCETNHLSKRFKLAPNRIYQLIKRLVDSGFVISKRLFCERDSIYYLTEKGAEFTDLPKLANLSLGTYYHNVILIDLYLKLSSYFPGAVWISERQLLNEKFRDGVGKRGHSADGIMLISDKQIAIELELTPKGLNRLEGIIKSYSTNFSIKEVWYFCSKQASQVVKRAAGNVSYVKIFDLDAFLSGSIQIEWNK